MVDSISGLRHSAVGHLTNAYNAAKNFETPHLGKLYTNAIDSLDYWVVDRAAKPILKQAPDWVTDNKFASFLQNHKTVSIASISLLVAFLFLGSLLRPFKEPEAVLPGDLPDPNNNEPPAGNQEAPKTGQQPPAGDTPPAGASEPKAENPST